MNFCEIVRRFRDIGRDIVRGPDREKDPPFSMLIEAARLAPALSMDRRLIIAAGLEHLKDDVVTMLASGRRQVSMAATNHAVELRQLATGVKHLVILADAILHDFYMFAICPRSSSPDVQTRVETVLPNLKEMIGQNKSGSWLPQTPSAFWEVRKLYLYYENGDVIMDRAAPVWRKYMARAKTPQPHVEHTLK